MRLIVSLSTVFLLTACGDGTVLFDPSGTGTTSSSSGSSPSSGSTSGSGGSGGSTATTQAFEGAVTGLTSGESFQWSLSYGSTVEATGTLSTNDNLLISGPPVTSQTTYTFSVTTQPAGETCSIANASGTITGTNTPSNLFFTCTPVSSTPSQLQRSQLSPTARKGTVSWVNPDGTFSLFGGESTDAAGVVHTLNDMWSFNPGTQTWTVVEPGSNPPPSRSLTASWIDTHGNVWIFGGRSVNGDAVQLYNDLWRYSPSTQRWDCESGCSATGSSDATDSLPAPREAATAWVDSAGELWLFGGTDAGTPIPTHFGDLWRYNTSTLRWTQVPNTSIAEAQ